ALNVRFRDVRYVLPYIVQLGLFLSPVGFSTSAVPAEWRLLFHLNPVVFAIDGRRWSLLGVGTPVEGGGWALSLAFTAGVVILCIRYFRKTERTFADVI